MRVIKLFVLSFLILTLAACSSLSLGTAIQLQKIDWLKDDVANMTFALDLPSSLKPVKNETALLIDATTSKFGERNIEAILEETNDLSRIANLPQLAKGRVYYLFSISKKGQEEIEEFQQWAKDLKEQHGDIGGKLGIGIQAEFCRSQDVEVKKEKFSVFVSLPGKVELSPLISSMKISEVMKGQEADIEMC